jgi:two-component system phosphate regulon response regulator PhoB
MRQVPLVLVVEDEPDIAELIMVNLRHNGFRSVWVASGEAAQAALQSELPDVILLDWMLPAVSGLTLAKRWRQSTYAKDIPILMLTARGDEADRVAGLDAGADDYIAKPFSTKELLSRIRAVLRRRAPEPAQEVLTIGALKLDAGAHQVSYAGKSLKLGPTEFKLLAYLMTHAQRVHTRAQLLDKIWGNQVYIEDRTVDVHVKRLRQALGDAATMVETVRGVGYRMAEVPDKAAPPPIRSESLSQH